MTSQTRAPEDVARGVFGAVSNHNLDVLDDLVPPDAVEDVVAVGEFRGPHAIRGFYAEMIAAFPDFTITIDRILSAGSTAVVQWHASGEFTGGAFQGIQPTGRGVELRGVDVMDTADGKVRRNTVYFDSATMARHIGALPQKDSPADRAMLAAFNAKTRLASQVKTRVKTMRERRHRS